MKQSICTYGFIPVRSEPAESAQLETQILFGETFDLLEHTPGWVRIKGHFDGYEGWVDEKLVEKLDDLDVEQWRNGSGIVVNKPFVEVICEKDSSVMMLSAGSRIVFNCEERNAFKIGNAEFYWQGHLPDKKSDLEMVAKGFLNAPYLWGDDRFMELIVVVWFRWFLKPSVFSSLEMPLNRLILEKW